MAGPKLTTEDFKALAMADLVRARKHIEKSQYEDAARCVRRSLEWMELADKQRKLPGVTVEEKT